MAQKFSNLRVGAQILIQNVSLECLKLAQDISKDCMVTYSKINSLITFSSLSQRLVALAKMKMNS